MEALTNHKNDLTAIYMTDFSTQNLWYLNLRLPQ